MRRRGPPASTAPRHRSMTWRETPHRLSSARGDEPVDLQLVLAVDSSSSVSMDEYYLQLQGYAAAFRHPELLKAIRSGSHQAIAVMLFEWSSERQQTVNFEWRRLADDASL